MRRLTALLPCLLLALLTGCQSGPPVTTLDNPAVHTQTIAGIGACQGVFIHEGSVWLYGDKRGKGVVKRLEWIAPTANSGPSLVDTEEIYELVLYRNFEIAKQPGVKLGTDPVPHPTGLTHHPKYDAFIGNTTDRQGTIYALHFLGLTESGSLDNWISNKTLDDLATNGTRPQFVRHNDQWLIATADDGDEGNQIRLYDPAKLKKAKKTSDPGVLVAAFDCGPFVQSLHWIDQDSTLVLVHNKAAGVGGRLTLMKFNDDGLPPTVARVIEFNQLEAGLKGFGIVAPGWAVIANDASKDNVSILRWPIKSD